MFDLTRRDEKEVKRSYSPSTPFSPSRSSSPILAQGPRIDLLPKLKKKSDTTTPTSAFDFIPAQAQYQAPIKPSTTWEKVKVGDIKGLASEVGLGLAHGLSKTGTSKQNEQIAKLLTQNTLPGMAGIGERQLAGIQSNKDYLQANPADSLPAILGQEIPMIPLWMAGEGAVGAIGKGIGKVAPRIVPTAQKVSSKVPKFIQGGARDAAAYGSVVAPVESIREGEGFSEFLDREKNVPGVFLGGAAFRGAGVGVSRGAQGIKSTLKPRGVPQAPFGPPRPSYSVQRRIGLGPLKTNDVVPLQDGLGMSRAIRKPQANPLDDVQSAYSIPANPNPIIRSTQRKLGLGRLKENDRITPEYKARQAELTDTFKDYQLPNDSLVTTKPTKQIIEESMRIGKTGEYQGLDAFGKPLNNFKKSTDTQDAIAEITKRMTKQANDVTKMIKQTDSQSPVETIRSKIFKMGGIKPSKGDLFEEQQVIPAWIKNNNGRPLDEVADTLGMTSEELRGVISSEAFKPKNYADEAFKVLRNDLEYQANNSLLETLRGQLPGKRTLDSVPKLKPREITSKSGQSQKPDFSIGSIIRTDNPLNGKQTLRVIGNPSKYGDSYLFKDMENGKDYWISKDAVLKNLSTDGPAPIQPQRLGLSGTLPVDSPVRQLTPVPRQPMRSADGMFGEVTPGPITAQGGPIRPIRPIAQQAPTDLPTPQSSIIIGKQKERMGIKDSFRNAYDRIVNNQQAIVDGAKITNSDMGRLASNTKNVSGIVDYNFLKGMVNKKGDKVSESLKVNIDKIPKGKEEDFWTYMSQRHNIDRAREGKNVQANYTPEMSAEAVRIAEEANPAYKAAGDDIVKWLDDFMTTWGVETGIVNKEVYANLRQTYKSYFPTQRDFSELEKAIPDNVSQKFADQRTPIRKATTSKRDIIDPVENIMKLVDRTIRTAKYNEVGQSLLESVRTAPEKLKPLAEVIEVKDGMFANTDNIITVLEDGQPVYLKINDKRFLDVMNGLPKSIGQIPVLSTLTNGFKQLITQSNPIFAVRNIFRDIPTAYVYGSEANPVKFGAGLIGAAKDIATNSPRLQKYQAVGGGGANFFSAGDITKSAAELTGKINPIKKVASAPIKAIQKFNNMTETAPRLAEFNRVLAKTGDVDKALFAANDVTVNFSRGGNITKNVDKVVPYMNAGVQGLDKFFRGFKDPKTAISTITKSGVAITTPTLALYLVNKDNPNYEALDNRTKDNYYLIPKEDGTFIKLPKSRELGVLFSSLLERGLRAKDGQENSFKGFRNTVATNFSPANPVDSNFFAPLIYNLPTNKDFANRAIVPQAMLMDKRSKYLQYDEKTTTIAKAIGEMSKDVIPGGISPKQLDYLVKSYSGVLGQFGMPLATPGGNPKKALTSQFVADSTFSNQATTDFYDKLDKLSAKAVDKNIIEKIPSKKLTPEEDMRNSMNAISSSISKGTKLINSIQATNDPLKDEKIKSIKAVMVELTKKGVLADTPKLMQKVEDEAKKKFK